MNAKNIPIGNVDMVNNPVLDSVQLGNSVRYKRK
jgi:hypothetical protein